MKPNILLFKRLVVQPSGMISGGFLQYNIDDVSGVITYNAEVDCHFLFISKSFPFNDNVKVDPAILKSSAWAPGKVFAIGPVQVDVVSVDGGVARATVSIVNGSIKASGDALFDVSASDIALKSLSVDGSVLGYNVHLELSE